MFVDCLPAMPSLSERAKTHGFVIADLFGRCLSLLGDSDYAHILQCSSMQEMILRLSRTYPILNEEMPLSTKEIERRLVQSIRLEVDELSGSCSFFVGFFVQYHRIQCFFHRLRNPESDSIHHLGDFPELRGLRYCKTFSDVRKLVLRNSRIEEFFGSMCTESLESCNVQVMYRSVMKSYYDHYCRCYKQHCGENRYFEDILRVEMDAFVLDLCMGGDPLPYIPSSYPPVDLGNLSTALGLKEPSNGSLESRMIEKQARVYHDSFRAFNDASCIYAYLRLKELEMRRVLFVIESSLNKEINQNAFN